MIGGDVILVTIIKYSVPLFFSYSKEFSSNGLEFLLSPPFW